MTHAKKPALASVISSRTHKESGLLTPQVLSGWNLWASVLKATQDEGSENSGIQNKIKGEQE